MWLSLCLKIIQIIFSKLKCILWLAFDGFEVICNLYNETQLKKKEKKKLKMKKKKK